jgi:flagellar hook assembly protein FlgD
VEIKIYDLQGKEVITLENKVQEEGEHKIVWNGRTTEGKLVSTGAYFYQIIFKNNSITKRLLHLK